MVAIKYVGKHQPHEIINVDEDKAKELIKGDYEYVKERVVSTDKRNAKTTRLDKQKKPDNIQPSE